MLNLVRARPCVLKLAWVGPHLLKLVRPGRCLLNLAQVGRLVIGGCSSDAALVGDSRGRDHYRRGCGGSLVCCGCGRSAGQE